LPVTIASGGEMRIFPLMKWEQFAKKKRSGRPPRLPVEKLQTIAWVQCLASMSEIDTENRSDDQVAYDLGDWLDEAGYVGPKQKKAMMDDGYDPKDWEDSSSMHSCKDWIDGSVSPKPDSIKDICVIVDSISSGFGAKLWSTFYYGIEECPLWHAFDQYNNDPYYDVPRHYFSAANPNLGLLSSATDNAMHYLTRDGSMPGAPAPVEILNQFYIGGLFMQAHKCASELGRYGISPEQYVDVVGEQAVFLIAQNPIKYQLPKFCRNNDGLMRLVNRKI